MSGRGQCAALAPSPAGLLRLSPAEEIGVTGQFAATQHFGRFRREADID